MGGTLGFMSDNFVHENCLKEKVTDNEDKLKAISPPHVYVNAVTSMFSPRAHVCVDVRFQLAQSF